MLEIPDGLRRALAARYRLEDMIGRGGMATVYRARDVKHNRLVAVKVLRPDLAEVIGPTRFLREIEIAARLTHPNILPLHDSGEADGALYYVMPFVEGESLRGLLNRVRLMDTEGTLEIVRRMADALDYAHGQGIVHRDIKPENILLPGGQPVLADFGIAKAVSSATDAASLTRTGIALGTPGYMSPEQAAGVLDLDATTDVYSLGVVTYEMLVGELPRVWVMPDALATGRFPDMAPEARTLLDRLPAGMERALVRTLAIRPEERFPSPGEFATALEHPESVPLSAPLVPPVVAPAATPETGRAVALPTSATPAKTGGILGAPTHLVLEHTIMGEVPPDDFDVLVEEIGATFHRVGYTARTDRSLTWVARQPKGGGFTLDMDHLWESMQSEPPDVLVRVNVRGGTTRIRVEQRLGEIAGGVFGGIWGGGGGGGVGTWLPLGIAVFHFPAALIVAGTAALAGGTYVLSREIYRAVVSNRHNRLRGLLERLVEVCEESAR